MRLVFYKPGPGVPYRLWLPLDSKRVLYISEMEYYLEQYEELRGRIRGKRFDLQTCPDTKKVDDATGVEGLFGYRKKRVTRQELQRYLARTGQDLAKPGPRGCSAEPLAEVAGAPFPVDDEMVLLFPDQQGAADRHPLRGQAAGRLRARRPPKRPRTRSGFSGSTA